jgi:hypothetical protein
VFVNVGFEGRREAKAGSIAKTFALTQNKHHPLIASKHNINAKTQWGEARAALPGHVRVLEMAHDDSWMRDTGPTVRVCLWRRWGRGRGAVVLGVEEGVLSAAAAAAVRASSEIPQQDNTLKRPQQNKTKPKPKPGRQGHAVQLPAADGHNRRRRRLGVQRLGRFIRHL